MGIGGGCVVDGFFAIVAVGFCCSGNRLCLDWMVGFFDWLYEFERKREVGGGGWVFLLLFIYGGCVLSNTEMVRKREHKNGFWVWLLVGRGRKRGKGREREREIVKKE